MEISFWDPRKMGLVDPSGQLTKRFDPEDLVTFTLTGTITNLFVSCGMHFLEMIATKVTSDGRPHTRTYTLMEDDIRELRKMRNG